MISILNVLFAKFYKNIIDILPNIFSQYFIIQFFRRVVNLRQFETKTIFKKYILRQKKQMLNLTGLTHLRFKYPDN
jgi:hypothetical protein